MKTKYQKTHFFVVVENEKEDLWCYGDESKYTKSEAIKLMKEVLSGRKNVRYKRYATQEDIDRLL